MRYLIKDFDASGDPKPGSIPHYFCSTLKGLQHKYKGNEFISRLIKDLAKAGKADAWSVDPPCGSCVCCAKMTPTPRADTIDDDDDNEDDGWALTYDGIGWTCFDCALFENGSRVVQPYSRETCIECGGLREINSDTRSDDLEGPPRARVRRNLNF